MLNWPAHPSYTDKSRTTQRKHVLLQVSFETPYYQALAWLHQLLCELHKPSTSPEQLRCQCVRRWWSEGLESFEDFFWVSIFKTDLKNWAGKYWSALDIEISKSANVTPVFKIGNTLNLIQASYILNHATLGRHCSLFNVSFPLWQAACSFRLLLQTNVKLCGVEEWTGNHMDSWDEINKEKRQKYSDPGSHTS